MCVCTQEFVLNMFVSVCDDAAGTVVLLPCCDPAKDITLAFRIHLALGVVLEAWARCHCCHHRDAVTALIATVCVTHVERQLHLCSVPVALLHRHGRVPHVGCLFSLWWKSHTAFRGEDCVLGSLLM